MSTPRWLRERRRWIKACENYRPRLILPMPPHEQSAADLMGSLWTIPESTTPQRPRRKR